MIYDAPHDARKLTTSDISLVLPYRFKGIRILNSSFSQELSGVAKSSSEYSIVYGNVEAYDLEGTLIASVLTDAPRFFG